MVLHEAACSLMKTNDYSKLYLWGAKLYLGACYLWPRKSNKFIANIMFIYHVLGLSTLIVGMILYASEKAANFNEMTFAICLLILPVMVFYKTAILWYKSDELYIYLNQIMDDFWPYDLTQGKSKLTILIFNKYSNTFTAIFIGVSVSFSLILFTIPLLLGRRVLPFSIDYPFNWKDSPGYELLYCQQVLTFCISMMCVNLGADLLILGLLLSITSQYCILQDCLSVFNTEAGIIINEKLRKISNNELEKKYDIRKEYFVRCVQHHRMLLSFTKGLNDVLNPLEFGQLAFTCLAIGLGTLRLTSEEPMSVIERMMIILYVTGIVMQLSIDCFLGTRLYYEASLLPTSVFHSNWLALDDNAFKKDVKFFLLHTQKIPQFNAYGLYNMHMISFIQVLKLAFSLYTLLSSIGTKEDEKILDNI